MWCCRHVNCMHVCIDVHANGSGVTLRQCVLVYPAALNDACACAAAAAAAAGKVMVLEAVLKGIKSSEPTDKVVLVSNYTGAFTSASAAGMLQPRIAPSPSALWQHAVACVALPSIPMPACYAGILYTSCQGVLLCRMLLHCSPVAVKSLKAPNPSTLALLQHAAAWYAVLSVPCVQCRHAMHVHVMPIHQSVLLRLMLLYCRGVVCSGWHVMHMRTMPICCYSRCCCTAEALDVLGGMLCMCTSRQCVLLCVMLLYCRDARCVRWHVMQVHVMLIHRSVLLCLMLLCCRGAGCAGWHAMHVHTMPICAAMPDAAVLQRRWMCWVACAPHTAGLR
jgi:hypothetical protein